jgi:Uma2 family endonuclease
VKEYWLIDSRVEEPSLVILRQNGSGYKQVPTRDGWVRSKVLGAEFRLVVDAESGEAVLERR